ncbi:MAG: LCP family protein [Clostridia bacterium]|nr:LCP family protein [Clostridia bacterium]
MKRRRKKVRKPFFTKKKITIFTISLIVIVAVSAFLISMGSMFTGYDDVDEIVEVEKETGKVNFLLVGIDKEASLTDTIMVASYDLDENKVNILSIPRDTRMYVGGRYQKINSAYSIRKDGKKKGINGTIEAVSRLTKLPINYYVEFSLTAFRDTIDALGGVEFDVPQNMNYDDPGQGLSIHLKKGFQLLDGNKAEQLVRFRNYPMGDIDRTKVQQSFVKAVAEQKLNLTIIERIPELYKTVSNNLKTNLEFGDVAKYALSLPDLTAENVNLYGLPGTPNSLDYGASYWIPDMPAVKELVEVTFGYDADGATIHSADGSSISKDVKLSTPSPSPIPEATKEPEETPKTTKKPTVSSTPKATKTPEATSTPKATKTPESTKTPEVKPTATPTPTTGGIKRPSAN